MQEELLPLVNQIINPLTEKTLAQEKRIISLEVKDDRLTLVYRRDGIDSQTKRRIENEVYNLLQEKGLNEDQIFLKSISESSDDMQATGAGKAPAQLRAGHAPMGAKKRRVAGAKKVIAISSCKGGVGKSSVAVNLALTLSRQNKKVGIIDADIYGPSVPMLLNQRGAQPKGREGKIFPIESYGIKFMSFGLFIKEAEPVIWRGPMLGGVLNQFLFDVEWGDLDFLIIDLPPGTGDMQLSMVQATEVDGIVVVSTPQDVALLDSKKGLKMFEAVQVPIIGMVENMSYFVPDDAPEKKYYIFGEGGVEKACRELEVDYLGGIPFEIPLREGGDQGKPYMANEEFQKRPVWESFTKLGDRVIQKLEGKKERTGFFQGIFGRES